MDGAAGIIDRRAVLGGLVLLPFAPLAAQAAVVLDVPLNDALRALSIKPEAIQWSNAVTLGVPPVAEDPSSVPITVKLSEAGVQQLHLFAPGNRRALVASLSPLSDLARPEWLVRIRVAKTQSIAAVAQTADGRLLGAMGEIKVTVQGGCRP